MDVAELQQRLQARRLPRPEARRALRLSAGARQVDVAEACGVSVQAVCFWESGIYEPRAGHAEKYAACLEMFREMAGP